MKFRVVLSKGLECCFTEIGLYADRILRNECNRNALLTHMTDDVFAWKQPEPQVVQMLQGWI